MGIPYNAQEAPGLVLLGFIYLFGSLGCGNTGAPHVSYPIVPVANLKPPATGDGCIWQDRVALVVFADVAGSEGSASWLPNRPKFQWFKTAPDGRQLNCMWETDDGRSGTITINGQKYDFAQGSLFLVSVGKDSVHISQLQRDFEKLARVRTFPRDDPDVAAFLAQTAKSERP
jgi:hypothetical protein